MSVGPKQFFMYGGGVLAIAGLVLLRLLIANGAFTGVTARSLASCTSTTLAGSAADFEIDRSSGTVYLSVLDRRAALDDPLATGSIFRLDLKQPNAQAIDALADAPQGFRPEGLSLWGHGDGPARLFAVNRAIDASGHQLASVEIFEQRADGRFHHLKSVTDSLFVHPNDVAAVGPEQFYLTNDRGGRNFLTRAFEAVIQPGWSDLLYYDGTRASVAASGRTFATGVAVSADGLRLYLAEAGAQQLLIFDRDTVTGSLFWRGLIEVAGAPDKLSIGADGSLWAAVEPNRWALERSVAGTGVAPTMVLRFPAPVNGFSKAQTIYANDGREFSGGTVASSNDGRVLLGSLTEKRLVTCLAPAGS